MNVLVDEQLSELLCLCVTHSENVVVMLVSKRDSSGSYGRSKGSYRAGCGAVKDLVSYFRVMDADVMEDFSEGTSHVG